MDEQPKRVSPFFRQALPPDPLPLLTSQMSLGESTRHAGILSNQELPPPGPHRGIAVHEAPVSIASVSAAASPRSVAVSCRDQSDCSTGGVLKSLRRSETEGDAWSGRGESEREGRPHKIPKPRGEVGRPGSGGYNLKAAMGWNGDEYERLRVREILVVLGFSSHVFPGYCHETCRGTSRCDQSTDRAGSREAQACTSQGTCADGFILGLLRI